MTPTGTKCRDMTTEEQFSTPHSTVTVSPSHTTWLAGQLVNRGPTECLQVQVS